MADEKNKVEEVVDLVPIYKFDELFLNETIDIENIKKKKTMVTNAMRSIMKDGFHYGISPGTNQPALYKAGAVSLKDLFKLRPEYTVDPIVLLKGGHYEIHVKCKLYHIFSNVFVGEGIGICSTEEIKYKYRNGHELLGLPLPDGYWKAKNANDFKECKKLLEAAVKKVGLFKPGAKYSHSKNEEDNKWEICEIIKVENIELGDLKHTILQMSKKRAFVDAVIIATGASDLFIPSDGDDQTEASFDDVVKMEFEKCNNEDDFKALWDRLTDFGLNRRAELEKAGKIKPKEKKKDDGQGKMKLD